MNTIGYARVSTEDQAKEGISLDNQKSKIEAYCQLKDLNLSEIIEDAGISAKNLKRPGIQKVLKMGRKKQVDTIVAYRSSILLINSLAMLALSIRIMLS